MVHVTMESLEAELALARGSGEGQLASSLMPLHVTATERLIMPVSARVRLDFLAPLAISVLKTTTTTALASIASLRLHATDTVHATPTATALVQLAGTWLQTVLTVHLATIRTRAHADIVLLPILVQITAAALQVVSVYVPSLSRAPIAMNALRIIMDPAVYRALVAIAVVLVRDHAVGELQALATAHVSFLLLVPTVRTQ